MKEEIEIVYEHEVGVRSVWGKIDSYTYEHSIKVELNDGTKLDLRDSHVDLHRLFKKLNDNKLKAKFTLIIEP